MPNILYNKPIIQYINVSLSSASRSSKLAKCKEEVMETSDLWPVVHRKQPGLAIGIRSFVYVGKG